MKYQRADGTTFVLAYHSPAEWADEYAMRLRDLGCSEQYVRRVTGAIRKAGIEVVDD